jgi:hypothetical protein
MIPVKNNASVDISPRVSFGDGAIVRYRVVLSFELNSEELDLLYSSLKTLGWVK